VTDPTPPDAARRALRQLWLVVAVVVFDVAVGGGWDAAYHRTEPFDGFFSPPHLFIYSLATVALALVARLVLKRELREQFGAPVPIRLPFGSGRGRVLIEVPAGLVLLAGGMAGLALAAPLDAIWHTRFGLDETPWSLPHAMLGTALLMIGLGVVAARIALAATIPMRPWTMPLLCLLLLFGTLTLLGPFGNASPAAVVAASQEGALATDPAAQRTFQIYLEWNLTRTNPLFIVLGAAWAGFAIAVTRPFLHRTWVWLLVLLVFGWAVDGGTAGTARELGLESDAASTAGIPILWAALPVAFLRTRPHVAYLLAGLVFGLVAYAQWGWRDAPLLGLAALPFAPVAALAGALAAWWTADVVRAPREGAAPRLLAVVVLAWPAVTGAIDLVLRRAT
jgi:hypothetical protein